MVKTCVAFAILMVKIDYPLHAQDFTREMSKFIGENARSFVEPVADGFMGDLNAGAMAVSGEVAWEVGARLVLVGVPVRDDQKDFLSSAFNETVEFQYNGLPFLGDLEIPPAVLPTAVGLSRTVTFSGHLKHIRPKGLPYVPGQYDFISQDASATIGGSDDVPLIPMFAPQVEVGSPWGTEFVLHFLPATRLGSVGQIAVVGFGLSHEIGQYFSFPITIGVQVSYGSVRMKGTDSDVDFDIDASGYAFQLQAEKLWGMGIFKAGPFAVVGVESSEASISYAFADPYLGKQTLSFADGLQGRLTFGGQFRASPFSVNGGYSVWPINGFEASIGVVYDFE